MNLQNRAAHWDGDVLVLEWRVVDGSGYPLTDWTSRNEAVRVMNIMLASERNEKW